MSRLVQYRSFLGAEIGQDTQKTDGSQHNSPYSDHPSLNIFDTIRTQRDIMVTYSVQTATGTRLKDGFKTVQGARRWAYKNVNPAYRSGHVDVWARSLTGKESPVGMIIFPGEFVKEHRWTPLKNGMSGKYRLFSDGSLRKLK